MLPTWATTSFAGIVLANVIEEVTDHPPKRVQSTGHRGTMANVSLLPYQV